MIDEHDREADGKGLLLVDLLSLGSTFSFRRYREDLVGFVLSWGVVGLLLLLAAWAVSVGG
jgi:hypothetical protein